MLARQTHFLLPAYAAQTCRKTARQPHSPKRPTYSRNNRPHFQRNAESVCCGAKRKPHSCLHVFSSFQRPASAGPTITALRLQGSGKLIGCAVSHTWAVSNTLARPRDNLASTTVSPFNTREGCPPANLAPNAAQSRCHAQRMVPSTFISKASHHRPASSQALRDAYWQNPNQTSSLHNRRKMLNLATIY